MSAKKPFLAPGDAGCYAGILKVVETEDGLKITMMPVGVPYGASNATAANEELANLRGFIEELAATKNARSYGMVRCKIYHLLEEINHPDADKVKSMMQGKYTKGALLVALQQLEKSMSAAAAKEKAKTAKGNANMQIPQEVAEAILMLALEELLREKYESVPAHTLADIMTDMADELKDDEARKAMPEFMRTVMEHVEKDMRETAVKLKQIYPLGSRSFSYSEVDDITLGIFCNAYLKALRGDKA